MELADLIVRPGDEVAGWGPVVRDADGDWFGPPLHTRLIWEPVHHSTHALRASGVDLDAVDDRRVDVGGTTGTATITAVWSPGHLDVLAQRRGCPDWSLRQYPDLVVPPCPAPPSGWPALDPQVNPRFELGDLEETGAAVAVANFRPSPGHVAVVVAAADSGRVEEVLRPQLGDGLCIVPARFTRPALERVRAVADDHAAAWGLHQWGETVLADGQPQLTLTLDLVTEEIAAQLAAFPDGMVDVHPWLRPSRTVPGE